MIRLRLRAMAVSADIFYGWVAVCVCIAAHFSKRLPLEWMALLLLVTWCISNIAHKNVRAPDLALVNLGIDSYFVVLTAVILMADRYGKLLGKFVVIWSFLALWDIGWYMLRPPHFYVYYLGQNLAMLLQAAILIAASYHMAPLRKAR